MRGTRLGMKIRTSLALWLLCAGAGAEDWPKWLGPEANGISRETGLLPSWPEGGPAVLWEAPLAGGFSCVSIAGRRAFTQEQRDGSQYLLALDEKTGRELWRTVTGPGYEDRHGEGPRATPTVDGGRVYALDGGNVLVCAGAADGAVVWRHDLRKEYGVDMSPYGWSGSPLVDGGLVAVNAGKSEGSSVLAFKADTGELAWRNLDDRAGYASGIVRRAGERREFVFYTAEGLVALDPADGRLLYRYPWRNKWNNSGMTPVLHGDTILISTLDIGASLLRVKEASPPELEVVWSGKSYETEFGNPILIDGWLYGVRKNSFAGIEYATGTLAWDVKGFSRATCCYADGRLYILNEKGRLVLARATPERLEEVSAVETLFHRTDKNWVMPVVANGRLYLRDGDRLLCLDVKAK